MARALFIHWKVPASQADAALCAARRMQQALAAAHPDLQAQLYQRAADPAADADTVTVMETYAALADDRTGIDAALRASIEAAASTALAGLPIIGTRHVEVFDRLSR